MEDTKKDKEIISINLKKQDLYKYSTFILLALVIIIGIAYFNKSPTGNTIINNELSAPSPTPSPEPSRVQVEAGDSTVKGKKNAPVTIIEFSDYECPFCGRHFEQTYPLLISNYVDTGQVKLVFKDFPLTSIHPNAQKAAEAARCVREQKGDDGYFKMHDKLFQNQQSLSIENYKSWAREIGAIGAQFDTCLDSGKFASAVQRDQQIGSGAGVQGTPAFFVNGVSINGAQPYEAFRSAIEAELA